MRIQPDQRPRILFLFSDTGGGHRSATEAIIEALRLEFGEQISTTMVDIFKEYARRPLNHMPDLYPHMMRLPRAWGLGYHLLDGHRRARLITASAWLYVRRNSRALIAENPCDLIVSLHPAANAPVLRALGQQRPPFVTVVTDLVTCHALWYHRRADLCLVPTETAYQRALAFGMQPDRVRVVGLPVAERFCQPHEDQKTIRLRLGWPGDRPIILLVGGGEGMGPVEKIADAITAEKLPATLVIVAGRNKELTARLKTRRWPQKTLIYGFVHEMPDFMHAADILVTKAGPSTISEAFIAGLPLVLYSRLPGQEDGNVAYVTSQGAGVWAPNPEQILATIKEWLEHPEKYRQAAAACRQLAHPGAARQIAHLLAAQIGVE